MATNIKTNLRTGGLPTQGPQGAGSFFGGLLDKLKSLTPKQKLIGTSVIVGIIALALIINVFIKVNTFVPLYSELNPNDVKAIADKLGTMKISYEIDTTGRTILVSPGQLNKARMDLALYGLPRTPVAISAPKEGFMPQSPQELEQNNKEKLEAQLIYGIREIQGVADAIVKITTPKEVLFGNDNQATAAVMVKLQPGYERLNPAQVAGIAHFVANSVRNLPVENVKIIGMDGVPYAVDTKYLGKEGMAMQPVGEEKAIAYENRLKEKVREALNGVLDPNKYTVALNVEFDNSQSDMTSETYGGPANVEGTVKAKEDTSEESFSNMPEAKDATQIGGATDLKGSQGQYVKKSDKSTYAVDKVTKRTVTAAGEIKRITASVAVDNLQPSEAGNIKELVAGAIGIDEARGDKVAVVSIPFSSALFQNMRENLISGKVPANPVSANPALNSALLLTLALTPMLMLIIIAAYFMLRQRNVIPEVRFNTQNIPSATQIDAGNRENTGTSTAFKLEMLAKEKPTRVAELLKSTWLADRER
ncbi:MAG: flagellar basal-body MS-ring/collar protein FliF [Armatimonadota bacterium]